MLSSAAQTRIISRISCLDLRTMKTPLRGTMPHQTFLLQAGKRLTDRRAADFQAVGQFALVEAQFGVVGIYIRRGNGLFKGVINCMRQARLRLDWGEPDAFCRCQRFFDGHSLINSCCIKLVFGLWYTTVELEVIAHLESSAN